MCMLPPRPAEEPVVFPHSSAMTKRRGHPFRQSMAVPTVGAVNQVARPQIGTDAGCHRFLSDIEVHKARQHPLAIELLHFQLEFAKLEHLAVKIEKLLYIQSGQRSLFHSSSDTHPFVRVGTARVFPPVVTDKWP